MKTENVISENDSVNLRQREEKYFSAPAVVVVSEQELW